MNLSLAQLRTFLEIAQGRSFRQTAEKLSLTQPAVSAQIRTLETELGAPLFYRQQVALTPAGNTFLPFARQIVALAEDSHQAVNDTLGSSKRSIVLGTSSCVATAILPRLIRYFQNDHPDVRITVHTLQEDRLWQGMSKRDLDCAIHYGPVPPFINKEKWEQYLLYTDTLTLIAPIEHPIAKASYFPLEQLSDTPLISLTPETPERKVIDRLLHERNQSVETTVELSSVEEVKRMVHQGLGMALIPRISLDPPSDTGIRALRIPTLQNQIPVTLLRLAGRYRSHLMERFLADIRGVYPSS
ncbi:DNA-binding transcriptional regulator, LysR family [Marininema mesophilum]|uniref:DNA-binding transcriptional regulator, LysR family n=1 Tax=Marininema mesophilum TaxID=1048340 RepID=A0A1H2VQS8_9BACL|nr:LysR family transcriptional regulator [Marininema mesophilum]SDW70683.1 DNA-binding transcriptional regulator, LysR family [Marininema mesophilum]